MKQIASVFLAALTSSCVAQTPAVLFDNITVIDGSGTLATPGMQVLTRGDRIAAVAQRVRLPQGATVVDGRGKYLIFGLSDMHVHLRGGKDLVRDNESWLTLFLVNGVTSIRDMGDDLVDDILRWRARFAKAVAMALGFSPADQSWMGRSRCGLGPCRLLPLKKVAQPYAR